GLPEPLDELLEPRGVGGSELEPGEEVERLSQVAPVVQTSSDPRHVFEPDGDVVGTLFEDAAALVLCELPPPLGLSDGDEGRARRPGPSQWLLPRGESVALDTGDVPLVASDSA